MAYCFILLIHNVFRGVTFYFRSIHLSKFVSTAGCCSIREKFRTGSGIEHWCFRYGHYNAFFKDDVTRRVNFFDLSFLEITGDWVQIYSGVQNLCFLMLMGAFYWFCRGFSGFCRSPSSPRRSSGFWLRVAFELQMIHRYSRSHYDWFR